DQRAWMRFPVQVGARYQKVSDPDSEHLPAEVLNISASGIGLLVGQPIDTGTLLSLELQPPSGKQARTTLACVVHVTKHGADQFALGCNFLCELKEEDLLALV